ncbi:peptide-methionine (S)-S-oxide reductase MsrA [Sphingobacterium corticibacterium]|uniref:Peptide methionine sulfoxide reductase MsrA n=1 Tax=Sphingobacterium corticibacterium TaxID=2484746 RepID=A0A4Q6XYH5_9SPHI|nr:peptide-methionine (S)-S-oxide reductase MsrA [Sphingobacterium corticibacterium]RZF62494.1 peptide-methionine (S)-S-oxide reductase [Sphingobacterium corticibacterium]
MKLQYIIPYSSRLTFFLLFTLSISCAQTKSKDSTTAMDDHKVVNLATDTATFAAGCFWCVEEQFKQLNGVTAVISGYTGGHVRNPTYRQVTTGRTGHAEACNIIYNPAEISYDELLAAFFVAHDPTQLNRQGADVGTQYRSAIFYHNADQKKLADYYIKQLNEEGAYDNSIVTAVTPYSKFYVAEDYHQNYYVNNMNEAYCQRVIKPKLEKFRKVFKGKLKQE